jgi:Sec-independent protein translocase protein TatA
LGIVEIIVILAVALIVIPPENLPDVMRATGKVLRELRLASNMVVRELGGALDQPADNYSPPVNTMKPSVSANGTNIAQSATPADPARPGATKVSTDDSAWPAAAEPSATVKPSTHVAMAPVMRAADALATTGTSAASDGIGPEIEPIALSAGYEAASAEPTAGPETSPAKPNATPARPKATD